MRWLVLTGLLLAGLPSLARPQEPFDTFSEPACGVRFRHPRSWVVVRSPGKVWSADYSGDQLACTFGLHPAGWAAKRRLDRTGLLREFPVTIAVVRRPFLEVAYRAGFSRVLTLDDSFVTVPPGLREGDWMIAVRQGNDAAEQFRTPCCQAVLGETWGNATAADGSRATVTATIAVVNDRRRHSAIIEGASAAGSGAVVAGIAASMRFSR
jgi:hypothetical protein